LKYIFSICILWVLSLSAKDPEIFYLSWIGDPSTTMVIAWHSKGGPAPNLYVEQDGQWFLYEAAARPIADTKLFINTIELTALRPDTRYALQFEKKGKRYFFRTLSQGLPVRFAVGGDLFLDRRVFKRMSRQVVKTDPDFIVLGGDLAYAQKPHAWIVTQRGVLSVWESFFRHLKTATITNERRLIPIVPIVGNHDITLVEKKEKLKPFFSQFFPYGLSYRRLQLNAFASLLLLDTGHLAPVGGAQKAWLQEQLQTGADYKIPLYHVAAYPSCYSFENKWAKRVRDHWMPLFERYGVKVAFEHHNHAFKRTVPINGIIYAGDGSWGVPPREVRQEWYLEKAEAKNSFWLVTLEDGRCHLEAFDLQGNRIDDLVL
jgi:hypothetical protein